MYYAMMQEIKLCSAKENWQKTVQSASIIFLSGAVRVNQSVQKVGEQPKEAKTRNFSKF